MVMFANRTKAALLAIVLASSLIVATGHFGFAFAAKKETVKKQNMDTISDGEDKSSSPKPDLAVGAGYSGAQQDGSDMREQVLKMLSRCESNAAEDGDLTLAEVKDCFTTTHQQFE